MPESRLRACVRACIQDTVKELEALRSKYGSLLTTAKSHEEMAGRAAREGQLRAEEVWKIIGVFAGRGHYEGPQ